MCSQSTLRWMHRASRQPQWCARTMARAYIPHPQVHSVGVDRGRSPTCRTRQCSPHRPAQVKAYRQGTFRARTMARAYMSHPQAFRGRRSWTEPDMPNTAMLPTPARTSEGLPSGFFSSVSSTVPPPGALRGSMSATLSYLEPTFVEPRMPEAPTFPDPRRVSNGLLPEYSHGTSGMRGESPSIPSGHFPTLNHHLRRSGERKRW